MPALDAARKKHFRSLGHKLNPVVTVSERGVTEGVAGELERALEDHELIKVKLVIADPKARKSLAEELCAAHKAELVQSIGKVILIYRAAKKPNPRLSNVMRG